MTNKEFFMKQHNHSPRPVPHEPSHYPEDPKPAGNPAESPHDPAPGSQDPRDPGAMPPKEIC